MNDTAAHRLLQIDRALRHRGGVRDLISQDPRAEAWLRWIATTPRIRTCGALEELQEDMKCDDLSQAEIYPSEPSQLGMRLCLYVPQEKVVFVQSFVGAGCRFDLSPPAGPGGYRLTTDDQTLLWRFDLAALWHSQPKSHVWRLAAAPPPEIKPLPGISEVRSDRDENDEPLVHDAAGTSRQPDSANEMSTLVQRWPVSPWAMEVQLHRAGPSRWLNVVSMQGGS